MQPSELPFPRPDSGSEREQLATYFLAMPPFKEQTTEEQQDYCRHLYAMGKLENREILQSAGAHRPLTWGNPVPHLQGLFTAAQHLAATLGYPLMIFPAKETRIQFHTLFHPRLLSLAAVNLLAAACTAAPKQAVWVRLREQHSCLTVTATAEAPISDREAFAVIKECAALHNGNAAHCDTTLGFSCGRVESPPTNTHIYQHTTADEWLQDTLSPIWTGFYSRLVCQ